LAKALCRKKHASLVDDGMFTRWICSWKDFKDDMEAMLLESDRKGMMIPRVRKFNRKNSIYTFPLPECDCLQSHDSSRGINHTLKVLDPQLEATRGRVPVSD
jgi:hypothetical protein